MSFSGLDITGGRGGSLGAFGNRLSTLRAPQWSENVADGGVSSNGAPAAGAPNEGEAVIHLRAATSGFVSIARAPNAQTGARYYVGAGNAYDFIANAGDKVAFSAGALSGFHVAATHAGGRGFENENLEIARIPVWSETLASAGTTTKSADQSRLTGYGAPLLRLRTSADAFAAVGSSPDATNGPKFFIPVDQDCDVFADTGDKVAWLPVTAFSGVHVTACYAGLIGFGWKYQALAYRALWSETITTAKTTDLAMPPVVRRDVTGDPIFRLFATVDGYATIIQAASPTITARIPVAARTQMDLAALPGDRISWQAA